MSTEHCSTCTQGHPGSGHTGPGPASRQPLPEGAVAVLTKRDSRLWALSRGDGRMRAWVTLETRARPGPPHCSPADAAATSASTLASRLGKGGAGTTLQAPPGRNGHCGRPVTSGPCGLQSRQRGSWVPPVSDLSSHCCWVFTEGTRTGVHVCAHTSRMHIHACTRTRHMHTHPSGEKAPFLVPILPKRHFKGHSRSPKAKLREANVL